MFYMIYFTISLNITNQIIINVGSHCKNEFNSVISTWNCIDWIQVNRMYVDTYLKYSSTLGRLMHVHIVHLHTIAFL